VDDEAGIREGVVAALADRYQVHAAASGGEALTTLRAHAVALIILDAMLGPERGLEFVPQFRQVRPAPILLLTAYGSKELVTQALRLKVDEYQEKPISVRDLRATVDRLVAPAAPPRPVDFATRACRYLDDHLAEPLWLSEVARHLGVSGSHLRQAFQDATGMTPVGYLRRIRMERAAHLLRTSALGIKEIAEAVAYPSHTCFGRVFRVVYGLSPSEFRAHAATGTERKQAKPTAFLTGEKVE
jgi:YesN/AraC family two-component response regulator